MKLSRNKLIGRDLSSQGNRKSCQRICNILILVLDAYHTFNKISQDSMYQ